MSSNAIAYALATIKTTPGSKAKKAMLEQLRDDFPEESARIMRAVFDVNTTYGFAKKIPDPELSVVAMRPRQFSQATWDLLDKLATRSLTGAAAKTAVARHLGTLSTGSRELLVAILQQNLRGGYGIDVVVEVWGPIVETFDICLAQEWRKEKKRIARNREEFDPKKHISWYPVWADIKYDGLRGVRFEHEEVLYSRKKLPLTCPPSLMSLMTEFLAEVRKHALIASDEELFLDCEIVSADGIFRDAMSHARASKRGAKENSLVVKVIDILTTAELEQGYSYLTKRERRAEDEALFSLPEFKRFFPFIALSEGRNCIDEEDVDAAAGEAWGRGLEGLIVEPYEGVWETKRSYWWMKYKAKGSVKGRIIGYEMSDPLSKNAGMVGSIEYELPSGVRGKCAGMTDEMRETVTESMDDLIGEQIEMEYHELTPDGVLRHPRIKAIRSDRP